MKISRLAFKAARVLLELEQRDVENVTGIPRQRISSYERGNIEFGRKTYNQLESFYVDRGIEFFEHHGVRRKPNVEYIPLKGTLGFRTLMDEVFKVAQSSGGRIEIINGAPDLFIKWLGEEWYDKHALRMSLIKDNIDFRIVVHDQQEQLIANDFATYRRIPQEKFNTETIYIYGDNVAFFDFTEEEVDIKIIRQPNLIKTFHLLFDLLWDLAE